MEPKTGKPGYGIDVWDTHPLAIRISCFRNSSRQREKLTVKLVFGLKAIDNRLNLAIRELLHLFH
ncbi:hypothetical protein HanXRQr2_Chr13g0573571 [Helianthus annuus]|uniref:Uncharacterized protein n=1 Tax=Helianthus annuus TaxID=4232 RepID=A0A9K3EFX9_HELAN|nr:hypothetical protein HanXRQr2_Chr13g0573571 [Helianthus annuus]